MYCVAPHSTTNCNKCHQYLSEFEQKERSTARKQKSNKTKRIPHSFCNHNGQRCNERHSTKRQN